MTPRSNEANEALRAVTRQRIIEVALSLFADHGYEATSVRMIAHEAGIAQGLLYSYFPGKDGLLRAIFQQSIEYVRRSFQAVEGPGSAEDQLARFIRASFAILRRTLSFWRLSYGVRMQAAVLSALGTDAQEWTAEIAARLEAHFQCLNVPDPAVEAAILFATIDGVAQHYALSPDDYPLAAVVNALVARYCPNAGPEGEFDESRLD